MDAPSNPTDEWMSSAKSLENQQREDWLNRVAATLHGEGDPSEDPPSRPRLEVLTSRARPRSRLSPRRPAAGTIGKIIPELDGLLTGASLRVPVPVG